MVKVRAARAGRKAMRAPRGAGRWAAQRREAGVTPAQAERSSLKTLIQIRSGGDLIRECFLEISYRFKYVKHCEIWGLLGGDWEIWGPQASMGTPISSEEIELGVLIKKRG